MNHKNVLPGQEVEKENRRVARKSKLCFLLAITE